MNAKRQKIVTDRRKLRGMESEGFIIMPKDATARNLTGKKVKVCYVQDHGPRLTRWYDKFTYRGKTYHLEYFDGCFNPFVVEYEQELEEAN